ncbi:AAA family ATPase [Nocardia camponoti]|uniref:Nuclease SbcCD subunit C n=1 Tax=Nocardia camponoti TaxID=1616106 RepID=A0A917QDT9_9NOCA|nr:AAA family ATPase [Nocardia camponoti]GGK46637.1 hypothetical protein GCM10011591_17550 [Nocardia camponoti]
MCSDRVADVLARELAADPNIDAAVAECVLDAVGFAVGADEKNGDTGQFIAHGVFLRSIAVQGFRGIGPVATLRLNPGPGLTLVVGRNGSGKSSFAEAAEFALTGGNRRWDGRAGAWKEGWRNLHQPHLARIEVELLTAGNDPALTIATEWDADAELAEASWTRRRGSERPVSHDPEAGRTELELYRPFLSYSELGALVDGKPSDLFDALHRLLGLNELSDATERVRARRLELERAAKDSRAERVALAEVLGAVDDSRVQRIATLLAAPGPDLGAIALAISGQYANEEPVQADTVGLFVGASSVPVDALRYLLHVTLPERATVVAAARRLVVAAAEADRFTTAESLADQRVLDLLVRARAHADAEDSPCACPVCGRSQLDARWRADADAEIAERSARLKALHASVAEKNQATMEFAEILADCPVGNGWADLSQQWTHWTNLREAEPSETLVARVETAHDQLSTALAAAQTAARAELASSESVWLPTVARVSAWLETAHAVAAAADELRVVKRAADWLKVATANLRGDRMRPLENAARWVWRTLRQQSNVELGAIRLQGSAGTARRVLLDVTVDDVDGAALGVMSQGELHALGLSLFLPRATVASSPFRFVMIDDPVQAMDPAKVDGLARVLAEVAETRQVVVFTHDERLAEAVRRMQLDATVVEVQRRERSIVETRVTGDPVRRYLDDARSLLRTAQLPPAIADELVATCCRSAIEAAGLAKARAELLARGIDHHEVERQIRNAHTTRAMLTLALMGPGSRVDDLNKHLSTVGGRWLVGVLRDATAGAHVPIGRPMRELIGDTERFISWLRAHEPKLARA